MAKNLTVEQRIEYANEFLSLDKDGNGTLDIGEITTWLKESGYNLTDAENKKVFKWMDKDGSGDVTLNEFLDAMAQLLASRGGANVHPSCDPKEEELLKTFKSMDTNGDGQLSVDEMLKGLKNAGIKVTRDQVQRLVKKIDKDKNGGISYLEFILAFR